MQNFNYKISKDGTFSFLNKKGEALKETDPAFQTINQVRTLYDSAFAKYLSEVKKQQKRTTYIDAADAANAAIKVVYKRFPDLAGAKVFKKKKKLGN